MTIYNIPPSRKMPAYHKLDSLAQDCYPGTRGSDVAEKITLQPGARIFYNQVLRSKPRITEHLSAVSMLTYHLLGRKDAVSKCGKPLKALGFGYLPIGLCDAP